MRRPIRSLLAVAMAAASLGIVAMPAGAVAPTITASQDQDRTVVEARSITITAQVKDSGGHPEPDGTLVTFDDVTTQPDEGAVDAKVVVLGIAAHGTGAGDGYWMLTGTGEVLAFGAAPELGNGRYPDLADPYSAIASNGAGYLLVTRRGTVYPFGLPFHGDLRGVTLNAPIVAATVKADGSGYRLFAQDGGVFDFGSATFFGAPSQAHLVIVSAADTPSGNGYRLLDRTGAVLAFGDAVDAGGFVPAGLDAAAIVTHDAGSYYLVDGEGSVVAKGGAPALAVANGGDTFGLPAVVAAAPTPDRTGIFVADYVGRLQGRGSAVPLGSVWTVPSVGGIARFTFTSAGAGRTRISARTADGGASTVLSQTWSPGDGYRFVAGDGGIFSYGDASFEGSTGGLQLNRPIVAMAATPSGRGYWLAASDGGVFAFGDARYLGSMGAVALNQPIVGMASTRSGDGYWLVARDGGIFAFGDAAFLGSTGGNGLRSDFVAIVTDPGGEGYWLATRDGTVVDFGHASRYGSAVDLRLEKPIVGMAPTFTGQGYWLVAADGGVFSFGDARFLGSTGNIRLARPVVGITPN